MVFTENFLMSIIENFNNLSLWLLSIFIMTITKYYQDIQDPIVQGQHQGKFRYWFGDVPIGNIQPDYTIDDLCKHANQEIDWLSLGVFDYTDHRVATFDIAQFVKINTLYHNLFYQDNIKPWLLYVDNGVYRTRTGDTRRRALELIPSITTVTALICAPTEQTFDYQPINCFNEFAAAAGVGLGTPFWFDIAAPNKNYGIEWYEVAVKSQTAASGQEFREWCRNTICDYIRQQPANFRFDRLWFTQRYDWNKFSN